MAYEVNILRSDEKFVQYLKQMAAFNRKIQFIFNDINYCIYQKVYHEQFNSDIETFHIVVSENGKILGALPLYIYNENNVMKITSNFSYISEPIVSEHLRGDEKRKIIGLIVSKLLTIREKYGIDTYTFELDIIERGGAISDWHELIMESFYINTGTKYVGSLNLKKIGLPSKKFVRKSYRSLINSGLKRWNTTIADKNTLTAKFWDEFRKLHFKSAGRHTRSVTTWDFQKGLIEKNLAYAVGAFDPTTDRMVGCGFYQHNFSQGYYAVAAYDRSLFRYPIGHVVQWIAINHAASIGLQSLVYVNDLRINSNSSCSSKEDQIQFFKLGFCNTRSVRLILDYVS